MYSVYYNFTNTFRFPSEVKIIFYDTLKKQSNSSDYFVRSIYWKYISDSALLTLIHIVFLKSHQKTDYIAFQNYCHLNAFLLFHYLRRCPPLSKPLFCPSLINLPSLLLKGLFPQDRY